MRDGDVTIVGGSGGTHARTEDLSHAQALLDYARGRLESVAEWSRVARGQVAADPGAVEGLELSAAHIDDALAWVNRGDGGADALADECGRVASALAETVRLIEGAEHASESTVERMGGALGTAWRGLVAAVELDAWLLSEAATLAPHPLPGMPESDPLPPPELTAILDPDVVQGALGALDSVPVLGSSGSLKDLLVLYLALEAMGAAMLFGNPKGVSVRLEGTASPPPPADVESLLERVEDLYPSGGEDASHSSVAVERVTHADGTTAWIVEIPGTEKMPVLGGSNPNDALADVQTMAGESTELMIGVAEAMDRAGVGAGEPVMLVGHSLGGITAMALASNEAFTSRFAVASVVTAGAPVGEFHPSDEVSILSLENSTDLVTALDGAPNPDQPNWITVTHDLRASADPADLEAAGSVVDSHTAARYVPTAALFDESWSPSAYAWRQQNAVFLDAGAQSERAVYAIARGADGA